MLVQSCGDPAILKRRFGHEPIKNYLVAVHCEDAEAVSRAQDIMHRRNDRYRDQPRESRLNAVRTLSSLSPSRLFDAKSVTGQQEWRERSI
jgi:hypothetical protein